MVCRPGFEEDQNEIMRHSAAHVLADAVVRLFPDAKPTIGPVIESGFFYDFYYPPGFSEDDLEKIEAEMKKIVKTNAKFERVEIPRDEAIAYFEKRGDPFKVEIIKGLPDGELITLYKHGEFIDLCKGPHVNYTKKVKAFKLLSVAGAYWRGDESREQLQRIYGTAFASKEELDEHLQRLEEAKQRDHRKLGKELELFSFHSEAPGSPFFKPKGTALYNHLVDYIRRMYVRENYQEVITPQVLDVELWKRSGHYDNFAENMFFTDIEGREFAVKPMNCPGHCLMFGERKWSYRELPVRIADFGRLHRFERSGVIHGLTRVRTFSQDDAHIFCTPDQMQGEIERFLDIVTEIYEDFEFNDVHLALATRPEKYLGDVAVWDRAEKVLADAMTAKGMTFSINKGEGAFYGPKIEFQVKDAIGRPWQLGTMQVDFSMPDRFDLAYVDAEQNFHRPVMLHRAILGSLERFLGVLIEHCAGAFPFWLSPEQIRVLTISESQHEFAKEVQGQLQQKGYRVEVDLRNEKLGYKIREAQFQKVPYMVVLGKNEAEKKQVSVRHRKDGDLGTVSLEDFVKRLKTERTVM